MPGRRRKNFKSFRDLAKQGASHYEVGYKNQRDPAFADSEVSDHAPQESTPKEDRLQEQMKYGVFFDDDYDYLQHLREVGEIHDSEMRPLPSFQMKEEEEEDDDGASTTASQLTLPGAAVSSAVERELGLLNVAAEPGEDWDPDIVAALDDNFDFDDPDNALDDDFMQMANAGEGPECGEDEDKEEDFTEESEEEEEEEEDAEEDSDLAEKKEKESGKPNEKAKTLTEWLQNVHLEGQGQDKGHGGGELGCDEDSMEAEEDMSDGDWSDVTEEEDLPTVSKYSASMVPRNQNLQLIDEMHQALMEREYGVDKIGALDGEELGGRVTFRSDLFQQAVKELEQWNEKVTLKDVFNSEERVRPVVPEKWRYVEEKDYSVEEEVDCSLEPLVVTKKPEFDCQSILSTYSRTKNLPTQIVLPEEWNTKKKKKKREPEECTDTESVSTVPGLTLKDLERQSRLERMADAPSTYRAKEETPEERRERKQSVKAYQKERRAEKKLNKQAFEGELRRQKQVKDAGAAQKRMQSYQS